MARKTLLNSLDVNYYRESKYSIVIFWQTGGTSEVPVLFEDLIADIVTALQFDDLCREKARAAFWAKNS